MPTIGGREFSRQELLAKTGAMDQIGGVRRVILAEGNEAGCEAAIFSNGVGLNFTVLLGRGMDISSADFCGMSLCWRSPTGDVHSPYFNQDGLGWLQSFYGGLVLTCGLSWAGAPCVDPVPVEGGSYTEVGADGAGRWNAFGSLGLHGRISHIPARNVHVDAAWESDAYIMWAKGKVRESSVFGPNFLMERTISAKVGCNSIWLRDLVRNEDAIPREHMMLYHCNLGFPLVDAGAEYVFPSLSVRPRDDIAAGYLADWQRFPEPTAGIPESVFYHEMASDSDGGTVAAFVNDVLGLGIAFRYSVEALPYMSQWKLPGAGHYVTGIEPATCLVEGRPKDRTEGRLLTLEPGEERLYELQIDILTSRAQLDAVREEVRELLAER